MEWRACYRSAQLRRAAMRSGDHATTDERGAADADDGVKDERVDVVVVGGGLAGLVVADGAMRESRRVRLLEARAHVGGRVRSVCGGGRDGGAGDCDARDRRLQYEAGPWRVPSDHGRVLALCAAHGVALRRLQTPTPTPTVCAGADAAPDGMSRWDACALARGPRAADAADLATGYADQTHAAGSTAPYGTTATTFWVADRGFSSLPSAIASGAAKKGVEILCQTRVDDVRLVDDDPVARYVVRATERVEGQLRTRVWRTAALFVCVPPSACRDWSVMRAHARPQMCAVGVNCLNHTYVRRAPPEPTPFHVRDGTALFGQAISDIYGTGHFQASYTSGRIARFWHRLWMHDAKRCAELLRAQLPRFLHAELEPRDVAMHFWERAYHYWLPAPHFDLRRQVGFAVTPNRVRLPGLYCAGEAFSSHQAWMEGALETAELALATFAADGDDERSVADEPSATDDADLMVFDGRLLDVASFRRAHPGGEEALRAHAHDADVARLFAFIGHSDQALATVFALQVGWAGARRSAAVDAADTVDAKMSAA